MNIDETLCDLFQEGGKHLVANLIDCTLEGDWVWRVSFPFIGRLFTDHAEPAKMDAEAVVNELVRRCRALGLRCDYLSDHDAQLYALAAVMVERRRVARQRRRQGRASKPRTPAAL